jgi:hypothetical protein
MNQHKRKAKTLKRKNAKKTMQKGRYHSKKISNSKRKVNRKTLNRRNYRNKKKRGGAPMGNQGRRRTSAKRWLHKFRRSVPISVPTTLLGAVAQHAPIRKIRDLTSYLRDSSSMSEKKADQRKCDNILVDLSESTASTTEIIEGMNNEDTVFDVLEGFLDGLTSGIDDELTRLLKKKGSEGIKDIMSRLEDRKNQIINACSDVFNHLDDDNLTQERCSGIANDPPERKKLKRQGSTGSFDRPGGPEWGFTNEPYTVTHPAAPPLAAGRNPIEAHALHDGIGGIPLQPANITNAAYFKQVMETKIDGLLDEINVWNRYIVGLFEPESLDPQGPSMETRVNDLLQPRPAPVAAGATNPDTITHKYNLLMQEIAEKLRAHIITLFDSDPKYQATYMIPDKYKIRLNGILVSINSTLPTTRAAAAAAPPAAAAIGPTHGTYTGRPFEPFNFATRGAENLVVFVDDPGKTGIPVTINLTADLTTAAAAATAIDIDLAGATVTVETFPGGEEALVITSNSGPGPTSTVDLDRGNTGPNALMLFGVGGGTALPGT